MKFTINAVPPSINQFMGRENVWEYRQNKDAWLNLVAMSARAAGVIPPSPIDPAVVTVQFFWKDNRARDPDNYAKFILDGLVSAKIIKDDSWQHITLVLCGGLDKQNPRVEITVEEA